LWNCNIYSPHPNLPHPGKEIAQLSAPSRSFLPGEEGVNRFVKQGFYAIDWGSYKDIEAIQNLDFG